MANTYTLIASSTVGSGGASDISFTSIPGTYTDLLLKLSTRDSRSNNPYNEISVTFNGSSTYSRITIYGTGSSAGSETDTTGKWVYSDTANATSSTFSNAEIYLPNYTGSNAKTISADSVTENNSATGNTVILAAGSATLTSAITSITLTPNLSNTFSEYSTAYLYGISNS
jgi:hypothetical protein